MELAARYRYTTTTLWRQCYYSQDIKQVIPTVSRTTSSRVSSTITRYDHRHEQGMADAKSGGSVSLLLLASCFIPARLLFGSLRVSVYLYALHDGERGKRSACSYNSPIDGFSCYCGFYVRMKVILQFLHAGIRFHRFLGTR